MNEDVDYACNTESGCKKCMYMKCYHEDYMHTEKKKLCKKDYSVTALTESMRYLYKYFIIFCRLSRRVSEFIGFKL